MALSSRKRLSAFLRRITLKNNGDFYYLNCLRSLKREKKIKSHGKNCKNKDFIEIVTPFQNDNILQFDQYMKSNKMPYITNAEFELKKIDKCVNNPQKYSITKIGKHVSCGYSISTIYPFYTIENKDSLYCGEDYMERFCSPLRGHATNIINSERKKMLPLKKGAKITPR